MTTYQTRRARELNAQRLRGGFFNISRRPWSLPTLRPERGEYAAGVKAYFRSVK